MSATRGYRDGGSGDLVLLADQGLNNEQGWENNIEMAQYTFPATVGLAKGAIYEELRDF